jgi:hypothetical protein
VSIWFYKESYWYKERLQSLFYSTKNHTSTARESRVCVVLQRIIVVQARESRVYVALVQIETPGLMLFYK